MPPRHAAAIFLVVAGLLALACAGRVPVPAPNPPNNPNVVVVPAVPPPTSPPDPAKTTADFVTTPTELIKDYGQNGSLHRQKYADKIFEVNGRVIDVATCFGWYGPRNVATLSLEASNGLLICHMADPEPWAKVMQGQEVTLRGRVPRPGESIVEPLVDCVIVGTGPSPGLHLTAEQLVRDAQADPKRYANKLLIVTGEVADKQTANGVVLLELTGDGRTMIRCQVYEYLKFTAKPVTVGQKLKVYGRYVTLDPERGVILSNCMPITRDAE